MSSTFSDSVASLWEAIEAFAASAGSVGRLALAIALCAHFAGQVLRAMAWRNIIGAALEDDSIPLAPVLGGLLAGVGLNGVVPARGGDAAKLVLVHRRVPKASYPLLTSSLVPETLFNSVMAMILFGWAASTHRLPARLEVPDLSAFELSWAAQHPVTAGLGLAVFSLALLVLVGSVWPRITHRWHEVRSGVRILRSPGRYLRSVVSLQAVAWLARVATAWCFLGAFGLDANIENALLVVMIQGAGSLFTLTPGGVGPKQALMFVVFADQASSSTVLAFSAGMEVILVVFQLVIGLAVAARMLDGSRLSDALGRKAPSRRDHERA